MTLIYAGLDTEKVMADFDTFYIKRLLSRIEELEAARTQRQWISDERLKELCESYAEYSHLAAVMRVAPNYQNWLIEQGLSNPLAPPKVGE